MGKCCAIDDLLCSKDHLVTVKKELQLLDSLFSQLLLLRKEYNCLFDAEDVFFENIRFEEDRERNQNN